MYTTVYITLELIKYFKTNVYSYLYWNNMSGLLKNSKTAATKYLSFTRTEARLYNNSNIFW